jgi:hypothetical protein
MEYGAYNGSNYTNEEGMYRVWIEYGEWSMDYSNPVHG